MSSLYLQIIIVVTEKGKSDMANSRIVLVCKHCGGEFYLAKGYMGAYSTSGTELHNRLNKFFDEHKFGSCSENDIDCSDNARNHFVLLEEGETLADVEPRSEVAREIFADLWEMFIPEKSTDGLTCYFDMAELIELKKKYTEPDAE